MSQRNKGILFALGVLKQSIFVNVKFLLQANYIPFSLSLSSFSDDRGCSFCGGLGHRITDCPKLEAIQSKKASDIGRKDYLANSAADW